jgi:hypothetical protein
MAAAEQTGIPRTTITYWLDQPEFVELRRNAREAMAEEAMVVARMAWKKLAIAIANGEIEARDLVFATGMATDKAQLLSGGATARTEARDITGTISDAELISAIREAESLTSGSGSPEEAEGAAEGQGL